MVHSELAEQFVHKLLGAESIGRGEVRKKVRASLSENEKLLNSIRQRSSDLIV